jgi:hypothetical protein
LRHRSGHTVISVRTHINLPIFCQIQANCQSPCALTDTGTANSVLF